MVAGDDERPTTSGEEAVFCDTGVLINYMNSEWERDYSTGLLEECACDVVISESVEDEFRNIIDRRADIYLDFLEFLLEADGAIEDYSPRGKRTANDQSHVVELQQRLATMDEKKALKRLRRFGRRYENKAEHLLDALIAEVVWAAPPMTLTFALDDVMGNANDATIVSDAADWSNDGGDGNFAALDQQDILQLAEDINEIIEDELGGSAVLTIDQPTAFVQQ